MTDTAKVFRGRSRVGLILPLVTVLTAVEGLVIQVADQGRDISECLAFNHSRPCATLTYALKAAINLSPHDPSLRIEITDESYHLDEPIEITFNESARFAGELTVTGKNYSRVSITCGNPVAGITVNRAQSVNFINIAWRNYSGSNLSAVVSLLNSRDIVFQNCRFEDNALPGLNAFDSSVILEDCVFQNNTSNRSDHPEAPNVHRKSSSGGAGAAFVFRHATDASVHVTRSSFVSNSAPCLVCDFHEDSPSTLSDVGGKGGGLLVVFGETAENCELTVEDTNFTGNMASFGGGLFVIAEQRARNNRFLASGLIMKRNRALVVGGAASVSQWESSTNFSITFRNCTVENNWSRQGAGVHVYYMNAVNKSRDSTLAFDAVRFRQNDAISGSAIRFSSGLPNGAQIPAVPEIMNCTFSSHATGLESHDAPLTSRRVSLAFRGLNVFQANSGRGAMALEMSNADIGGSVQFLNNSGLWGGALNLRASQLRLHAGSEMLFKGNHAGLVGGAIAVYSHMTDEVIHEYNPHCFLTYASRTPPSQWKTKISFIENSAALSGAAIHVSSLNACLWDEQPPHCSWQKSLRWNKDVFVYRDNSLVSWKDRTKTFTGPEYDIATDAARFHGNPLVEVAPGENVIVHVQALDQLNHSVYTVVSMVQQDSTSPLLFTSDSMHTLSPFDNNTLPLAYRVASNHVYHNLNFSAEYEVSLVDFSSTLMNGYSFFVQPKRCLPGFTFVKTKCKCNNKIEGVLGCDGSGTVFLQERYWAGAEGSDLVSKSCPFKYCKCRKQDGMLGCAVDPSRRDEQCANGRWGRLCGACPGNHSVGLRWEQCISDSKCSAWIVVPVAVLVVLLTVLVIWLNPSLSSELRGPLFFFQVIQFVVPSSDMVWGVIAFFANVFNFGGPLVYLLDTCIARGMDNLHMVALGYTMPFLTLMVFLICYILSVKNVIRFQYRAKSRLHSFWLIMLFDYHYILVTTFSLLNCVKVGEKYVFFYDGTVTCFEGRHRALASFALVVMVMFIIVPLIIIVLLTKGIWKVDPQYANALTNGLRPRCSWWWAFDLSRRIILVAVSVFITDYVKRQVHISLMCLLIFALHSNVQPYKRPWVNYQESFFLFWLCVISTLLVLKENHPSDLLVAILLIALTCYSFLLLFKKAYWFFRKRFGCMGRMADSTRPTRYGTVDSDGLERSLEPDLRERREVLDVILSGSTEVGSENDSVNSSK